MISRMVAHTHSISSGQWPGTHFEGETFRVIQTIVDGTPSVFGSQPVIALQFTRELHVAAATWSLWRYSFTWQCGPVGQCRPAVT